MAGELKRTYQLNVPVLDQLMYDKGMTLENLASRSGLHLRTLRRKRKGESAYLSTLRAIARALATDCCNLIAHTDGHAPIIIEEQPSRFRVRLKLSGTFHSSKQKEFLIRLNTQIMGMLAQEGIVLTGQAIAIATSHIRGAGALRFILAVRGVTNDRPSWFLATINPATLSALCQAEQIDANDFPFGEVLFTGWGRSIPRSIVKRASDLLRCRPYQIMDGAAL